MSVTRKSRRIKGRQAHSRRPKGKGIFVKVRTLGATVIMTVPLKARRVFQVKAGEYVKVEADKHGLKIAKAAAA